MSVLRGRLVSSCNSLPPNFFLHVLSYRSSMVLPGVSLPVVFHRFLLFLQICQSTSCVAGRRQGCAAFRMYDRNQLFLYAFLRVSPDWFFRGTTRCNPVFQHTMFTAGNVCFFIRVFEEKTGQVQQHR